MGYIPLKAKKKVLLLAEQGAAAEEISKTLGISKVTVFKILHKAFENKEETALEKEVKQEKKEADNIASIEIQPKPEEVKLNISTKTNEVKEKMNPTREPGVRPITLSQKDQIMLDPTTYKVADVLVERGLAKDLNEAIDLGLKMLYVKAGLDDAKPGDSMREISQKTDDNTGFNMAGIVKTLEQQLAIKMMKSLISEDTPKVNVGQLIEAQLVKTLEGKSGMDLKELAYLQALGRGSDSNPQAMAMIQNLQNQLNQLQTQLSSKQNQGLDPVMMMLLTQGNKNLPEVLGTIQNLQNQQREKEHAFEIELQKLRDTATSARDEFFKDKTSQTQELVKELKQKVESIGETRGIDKTISEQLAQEVAGVVLEKAKKGLSEARGETTTTDAAIEVAKTAMPLIQEYIKAGRQNQEMQQAAYLQQLAAQQAAQQGQPETIVEPGQPNEMPAQPQSFEEQAPDFSEFIPGESISKKKKTY